jgi:hypothetical protein
MTFDRYTKPLGNSIDRSATPCTPNTYALQEGPERAVLPVAVP